MLSANDIVPFRCSLRITVIINIIVIIVIVIVIIIIIIIIILSFFNLYDEYTFALLSKYRTHCYISFIFQVIILLVYFDIHVGFQCSIKNECIEESNINCHYFKCQRWPGSGFVQWQYFPCVICWVSKQFLLLFFFSMNALKSGF